MEVGFPPRGLHFLGSNIPCPRRVGRGLLDGGIVGDRSGAIRIRIHGTQDIFRSAVICYVFGRRNARADLGAGGAICAQKEI